MRKYKLSLWSRGGLAPIFVCDTTTDDPVRAAHVMMETVAECVMVSIRDDSGDPHATLYASGVVVRWAGDTPQGARS